MREGRTAIAMTDNRSLYQLMTWLSPSYPVGAYTYSHGLEQAIEAGWVTDRETTKAWVKDIVTHGDGFADAVMLSSAYRAANDPVALADISELALAFVPTEELALESEMQGGAFFEITQKAWPEARLERLSDVSPPPYAYAVVVGVAAEGAAIPLAAATHAYLHAFVANMVSAAVRLIPLGQTDGQLITAGLADDVQEASARAQITEAEDVATAGFLSDIASMRHETQYTRLFRS